ncbi:MAG: LEA type 2 family protein [Myxococcales bacterium]|nr:LEA type 2 family protein [Myxococcales bacterium]
MKTTRLLWLAALALSACKSGPEVIAEAAAPELIDQDMEIVSQSLTDCDVKLTGTVASADRAVTVESARFEFVVDGEVRRAGEKKLGIAVPAGGKASFSLEETLTYVKDEADLKAMDTRGGSLLTALRGTLLVRAQAPSAGGAPASWELEFARSKDVRTPRLPHLKLREFEAGRFAENEVQAVFHLGVENPNPFYLSISGLDYAVTVAGKQLKTGTIGAGEKISPSSTGVFDVTVTVNEESHGKDVVKLIKGLKLPFSISGALKAPMYVEPLTAEGEIKLNPPK